MTRVLRWMYVPIKFHLEHSGPLRQLRRIRQLRRKRQLHRNDLIIGVCPTGALAAVAAIIQIAAGLPRIPRLSPQGNSHPVYGAL